MLNQKGNNMAVQAEQTKTFPKIPSKVWWLVREKFKSSVPAAVSISWLKTVLNTSEASAEVYLAALKKVGLIDEKGVPTDLAYEYRTDEKYSSATRKILDACYTAEIRDLYPGPEVELMSLKTYMMDHLRLGQSAAQQMATFYAMIATGTPLHSAETAKLKSQPNGADIPRKNRISSLPRPAQVAAGGIPTSTEQQSRRHRLSPTLHIDIQIHISADASVEQIDHIFKSMANHLKLGHEE